MSQGALPGFRDFYPEQLATRNYLFSVWRDVARRYGFVEYDGPPLEPLDLYTKKSGDEIVGQLYTFTDKGDREVALRPEMTPTLARMVAARANAMRKPIRWFSIPQLFRYERQQKGRLREHFQLNVDIVGEASVAARVSDRGLLSAALSSVGVKKSELPAVFAAIDKLGREARDVTVGKIEKAVSSADARRGIEPLLQSSKDLDALAREFADSPDVVEEVNSMREYMAYLDALGVGDWVDFDLSIVRGLAYYTGKVFELFDAKGEFRAICGGGRYDDLLSTIGGVDLPALGFGMGDVVLTELLRARDLLPNPELATEYWVASDDESMLPDVMTVAGRLRAKARSVEYALKSQTLARQLKTASSAGVRNVVLLRRPDYQNGNITVKTLADGSERNVALDAFIDSL
jgi:histidyl-tRNA synthetase